MIRQIIDRLAASLLVASATGLALVPAEARPLRPPGTPAPPPVRPPVSPLPRPSQAAAGRNPGLLSVSASSFRTTSVRTTTGPSTLRSVGSTPLGRTSDP